MRGRGVPPAFWAPLPHDPLLVVVDKLIVPAARVLAWFSPAGGGGPAVDRTRELVLVERRVVAADEDVVSFLFADPRGAALRPWRPGAHLDVVLPSGRMRQYSLCGDPDDALHYRIAVRRIVNGSGSVELHDELRPGDRVAIRGPRNAFPLVLTGREVTRSGSDVRAVRAGFARATPAPSDAPRRLHFVAGGIGITPVLGMMRAADRAGLDWTMVYTGRHRDALPFLDEIAGYGERVTIRTDDVDGLPTGADLVPLPDPGLAVYVCGPPALLEVVGARVARADGVELHQERFGPPPIRDGRPFTVQWGRGGRVLEVPADRSVLEVVAEADPAVPYSCRQGFCTTCKVRVLAGTVDHRDSVLNDAQRSQGDMLICVSRADRGERLVLDVESAAVRADSRRPQRARLARAIPKRIRAGGVRRLP
ncbi:oxidoreductase [Nocardia sp. 2]|uniref:Oxidoreductase n=1 Tax=Nocardia acididurans TaxID=2802282 RepID=A0ABS1LZN2_9NOCA|nr:oxidoreductase [Nocardia acididurans]